ncbi:MAG: hypothetical protein PHH73_05040 [Candidatus Rickettsiella isopodorum]|nr:hypothetical protein [Candidatus Rickettsiella isopodorum]
MTDGFSEGDGSPSDIAANVEAAIANGDFNNIRGGDDQTRGFSKGDGSFDDYFDSFMDSLSTPGKSDKDSISGPNPQDILEDMFNSLNNNGNLSNMITSIKSEYAKQGAFEKAAAFDRYSLCYAVSLMVAHNENVHYAIDFKEMVNFLLYANDKTAYNDKKGNPVPFISKDGTVNVTALTFTQEYANFTHTPAPTGTLTAAQFNQNPSLTMAQYGTAWHGHKGDWDLHTVVENFYTTVVAYNSSANSYFYSINYTESTILVYK